MQRVLLDTSLLADRDAARTLRHLLDQITASLVPQRELRSRMALCVSEAVTNLVEHAGPQRVGMRFGKDSGGWWLELSDDGAAWDPREAACDPLEVFAARESGRGIAIINAQCDAMHYHEGAPGADNVLRLHWSLPSRRPTLLLVEDDPSFARLYTLYLEASYQVVHASDGEQALHILRKRNVELVLSDIQMPNMNGLALRETMMNEPDIRLTPFIFLTGGNDAGLQAQAAELGIDDYLVKPVLKHTLLQCAKRVLRRSEQVYRQLTERIDHRISASLAPELPPGAHGWRLALAQRHTGIGGGDLLLYRDYHDRLMLAMNDIMGHDDSAKFFAYAYAGYLRGLMHSAIARSPESLLGMLSDSAIQDALLSQVTLTCCAVSLTAEGTVSIASAGHPPCLHITREGVQALDVGGILPGLIESTSYTPLQLQLRRGERIAVYTDGLFESAADQQGRNKLVQHIERALSESIELPIEQARDHVMSVFDKLAGTPPRDDTMLLLIERKA